jgi:DNA-binding NarL/FixJ family response regulator
LQKFLAQQLGAHVHVIFFTHQISIASWLLARLDSFDDISSTTCVTTSDEYLEAARSIRTFTVLIGQLRTRDYCLAEQILQAEGIVPRRRVLNAAVLTNEFLRWASENQFDGVIEISSDLSKLVDATHTALTANYETAHISTPLVSGSLTYHDASDEAIVQLVSMGCTNVEIARSLNFSLQTVRNRISRILDESGARNRTHLAAMYLVPHALNLHPSDIEHEASLEKTESQRL